MRQYLLPKDFHGEPTFNLTAKESRYLTKVLRYGNGTRFNGIDQSGKTWDLVMVDASTIGCTPTEGTFKETSDTLPSFHGPYPHIRLYQCLCKGKKDETIVRQATEIGVERITFVMSRFCTVDLSGKNTKAQETRNGRMEAIIKEAIQQSGSPVMTQLGKQVLTLAETIEECKEGTGLFFHQCAISTMGLPSLLKEAKEPISILVGSEGGFSDEECDLLVKGGMHPVLLKTNILRAETAAIYALSAVQSFLTEEY